MNNKNVAMKNKMTLSKKLFVCCQRPFRRYFSKAPLLYNYDMFATHSVKEILTKQEFYAEEKGYTY